MKTLLKLLLLVAVMVYLIFAFTRIVKGGDTTKCTALNVVIADSAQNGFITSDEVVRLLTEAGKNPVGKEMENINSLQIEQALLKNSFIDVVKCYKAPGGNINVHVSQRLPILRVKAENGEDYYIDKKGNPMQAGKYSADLIVATGNINKKYAATTLLALANSLHESSFASDLIMQISVDADMRVDLVPRMGCEVVHFGRIDTTNVEQKVANLHTFYKDVLPTVGWNTYRELNLEYSNQIVCKKF